MKTLVLGLGLAMLAGAAQADVIQRACLSSDRGARNSALCGCIQQVADMTLSRGDQRKAAKFFKNPDLAQETRQKSDDSVIDFWDRYKNFGATAQAYCAVG
jgi:hypothetical protein